MSSATNYELCLETNVSLFVCTLIQSPFSIACSCPLAFVYVSDDADDATEVLQDKLQTITSRWAIPQLSTHSVPYLLATSDLLFGLATGMTIKFFPIFFLKQVGLAPVATNFVMAATPLAVAAVAAGSPQLASLIGEASMYACLMMCSIGCIFTMHTVASMYKTPCCRWSMKARIQSVA